MQARACAWLETHRRLCIYTIFPTVRFDLTIATGNIAKECHRSCYGLIASSIDITRSTPCRGRLREPLFFSFLLIFEVQYVKDNPGGADLMK